jgi:hypothetical protein
VERNRCPIEMGGGEMLVALHSICAGFTENQGAGQLCSQRDSCS